MKRFLSVAFAVMMVAGLSSCKKDYTCECTVSGQTISATYTKVSKGDATDACDAQEATYKIVDPSASCDLK